MSTTTQFRKDTIISVESELNPGVIRRYLVKDIHKDGSLLLTYQSEYTTTLNLTHLQDYMEANSITQSMLADMLGRSRSTIHRYVSGEREIPADVFSTLGITPAKTNMQMDVVSESLLQDFVSMRDRLNKIINTIQEEY